MTNFYQQVKTLHIEPTRKCNAQCPMCARFLGSSPNVAPWVNEVDVSIDQLTTLLPRLDLQMISINGNYGDLVMHHDPTSLVELCSANSNLVVIHTNGGAQNKTFWKTIGALNNVTCIFAIDGLDDTHHLYRRNTRFDVIINNAKTFIDAGGTAIWDMLIFEHNQHQVEECKKIATEMGFNTFNSKPNARYGKSDYPVHDKDYNTEYYIKSIDKVRNYKHADSRLPLYTKQDYDKILYSDHTRRREIKMSCIDCRVIEQQSIFISADNRVWPCCWLGQMANKAEKNFSSSDFVKTFGKTNTLENFDSIVKQFDIISQSWSTNKPFYECAANCNSNKPSPLIITTNTGSKTKLS